MVTFLYKLRGGSCDDSYGLNVARLARLPNEVLVQAKKKSDEFIKMLDSKTGFSKDKGQNDAIYIINEMKRLKLEIEKNRNNGNGEMQTKRISQNILKIWTLAKEMTIA